jgi:oligosaccharide repeat unit polymerase
MNYNNSKKGDLLILITVLTFLYLFMYPAVDYYYGIEEVPAHLSSPINLYIYFLYITGIIFVLLIINVFTMRHWGKCNIAENKKSNFKKLYLKEKIGIFLFYEIISLILSVIIFSSQSFDYLTLFNRANRGDGIFLTQEWVIYVLFMQVISFYGIYNYSNLSKVERLILLFIITLIFLVETALLGARRFSMAIVLFWLYSRGYIGYLFRTKVGLIIFILSLSIGLLFGAIREYIYHQQILSDVNFGDIIRLSMQSNEFNEIGAGVMKSILIGNDVNALKMGSTLFYGVLFLIPRDFYPDKPITLSTILGFPISIYSEMFVNFNLISIFVFFFIFLFVAYLSQKHSNRFWTCIVAAYAFDFIRAETGTIIYTLTVIAFFYYFIKFTDIKLKL